MTYNDINIGNFSCQPIPTKFHWFIDLTGKRFGRLTVIGFHSKHPTQNTYFWVCQCDCGNKKLVNRNCLNQGMTTSCGCYQRECRKARHTHNESRKTPEYAAYASAKNRCNSPTNKDFGLYGGRGIEFRFNSFQEFLAEVGRKPTPKHSLDRVDSNKHYEKGNLRWATTTEQNRNKRTNRWLTIGNQTKTMGEWAKLNNMPICTVWARLKKGWCDECAAKVFDGEGNCPHK